MPEATLTVRVKTVDEASGALKNIGDTAKQTGTDVEKMGSQADKATKNLGASFKSTALGAASFSTAAFSLVNIMDSMERAQLAVNKSNLQVDRSTKNVDDKQRAYNEAVRTYGSYSPQARAAANDLKLAQDALSNATEQARMKQDDMNKTQIFTAMSVLPTTITMLDGLSKMYKGLPGLMGNTKIALTGLTGAINTHKMAALSAGLAAGGMVTAYMAFTAQTPQAKAAYSILTGALLAAASAQWVLNIAASFGLGLTGAGLAIVGVAAGAAATTYALSSQYGAQVESGAGPVGSAATVSGANRNPMAVSTADAASSMMQTTSVVQTSGSVNRNPLAVSTAPASPPMSQVSSTSTNNNVTINVNGAGDPEAVAEKIVQVYQRKTGWK